MACSLACGGFPEIYTGIKIPTNPADRFGRFYAPEPVDLVKLKAHAHRPQTRHCCHTTPPSRAELERRVIDELNGSNGLGTDTHRCLVWGSLAQSFEMSLT